MKIQRWRDHVSGVWQFCGVRTADHSAAGASTGGPRTKDPAGEGTGGTFSGKLLRLTADHKLQGSRNYLQCGALAWSPLFGTAGAGQGEGFSAPEKKTLTPTLSRSTGRGRNTQ